MLFFPISSYARASHIAGSLISFSSKKEKIFKCRNITNRKELIEGEENDLFNFIYFLISLFYIIKERKKVTIQELTVGLLVGIPNLFSSFFLILALNSVKTAIAFPVFSAGTIVLINI